MNLVNNLSAENTGKNHKPVKDGINTLIKDQTKAENFNRYFVFVSGAAKHLSQSRTKEKYFHCPYLDN